MAFKMKGPSMHKGTLGHKNAEAAQRNFNEMKVNRDLDNTSVADGRAGSSAFQYKEAAPTKAATDKGDGYKYGKEKMVNKTVTKNTKGGEDTKTDYETKGTKYTPPTKTEEGDKKYASMSKSERKAADDKYIAANTKTNTKNRSETSSTRREMETTPKITPKKVKVKTNNEIKPIEAKETREQKRIRLKKEREDKRSYTVSSEKSTFKRKVIKDKKTGEERKVGRSKFGKLVSKVTGRDTQKTGRVKRRKLGKGKKRGGTSCSF